MVSTFPPTPDGFPQDPPVANFNTVKAVDVSTLQDAMRAVQTFLTLVSVSAHFKNVETLSADKTLADTDMLIQRLNCNGADRIVKAPPAAAGNHAFFIVNSSGGAYSITYKSNDGATTYATISQGQAALMIPDGAGGYIAVGSSESSGVTDHGALSGLGDDDHPQYMQKGTSIEGMELIWNSVNSLSVGTGVCYAENGDRINITSALTASSLSLSGSTWYHVYVYLSGGSPAMEVVTTAPVLWKGTAYSKTGDTSRRYMGSVKTDGSGNIYNFEHNPITNHILYRKQNFGSSPFRCLSSGVATSATSVSLATVVPVTAKYAWLRCSNSADQPSYFGVSTLTTSAFQLVFALGNVAQQSAMTFLPMDASQVVYYMLTATVGTGGVNIDVYGYSYKR